MQLHRITGALTRIPDRLQAKVAPVVYARRRGVSLGSGVRFYAPPNLGTEPLLISIGGNVHVTKGVDLLAHDGAVLIARKETPDLGITRPMAVGSRVNAGVSSILAPGTTIGDRCMIAAGSVLPGRVPRDLVAGGAPPRFIGTLDDYADNVETEPLQLGHLGLRAKEQTLKRHFGVGQGG